MNAAQVDAEGETLARGLETVIAAEGIVGPITVGKAARIRTIIRDNAFDDWTFEPFVDVARSNRIVVTATAFHGKVEA